MLNSEAEEASQSKAACARKLRLFRILCQSKKHLVYVIIDQVPHQAGPRRRWPVETMSDSNFGSALSISC